MFIIIIITLIILEHQPTCSQHVWEDHLEKALQAAPSSCCLIKCQEYKNTTSFKSLNYESFGLFKGNASAFFFFLTLTVYLPCLYCTCDYQTGNLTHVSVLRKEQKTCLLKAHCCESLTTAVEAVNKSFSRKKKQQFFFISVQFQYWRSWFCPKEKIFV